MSIQSNTYVTQLFNWLTQSKRVTVWPCTQIAFDKFLTARNIDYTKEAVILSQGSRKRDIDSFIYEIEEC